MPKNARGKSRRSFSIASVGKQGGCSTRFSEGRFLSSTAKGAALKAFTALCRRKRIKGQCTLTVTMKEITQGSKKKQYAYTLKRRKRKNPVRIRPRGASNNIVFKYETVAKSIKGKLPCRKTVTRRDRVVTRSQTKKRRSSRR